MQITELIMKNYDLAQSLQMKIVKDPSVRPAHEHPPRPGMESTTTVTVDRECTIQNQQTPKQNQQNPPVKIKSEKANQEKTNNINKRRNNQTPLKLKLKRSNNNNNPS